ncbi:MAG: hypothetical protein FWH18_06120 [Marinilabiliaceae bacterium]|nr:hypothetical protein [Marinilabiliaceae bacterium]
MIPDYVQQVFEIHGHLSKQALATEEDWQDSVAKRFYDKFIVKYEEKVNLYINGGMDITGKGLSALLIFFDEKEREMAALGGINISDSRHKSQTIHNEYRTRENWSPSDGPNPSELKAPEVKEIMNKRDNYW